MPSSRFDYVKYDGEAQATQECFKVLFKELAHHIEGNPQSRAQSLALTKLEESYMWVGKMLRDDQIMRNGSAPLQEQRADS